MVLWLVLVQERRLPVKLAADCVIHGQQVSLPARQDALSRVLGGCVPDTGLREVPGRYSRQPEAAVHPPCTDERGAVHCFPS